MRIGAIFPQKEIADPAAVRDYAQAVEALGYDHLLVYDHVLGADASKHEGWTGLSHTDLFHEPFVLFGYLGAFTKKIELATGILILGQRQTALVAKQAAAADVFTGGRLRLGVGIGWNAVEYEALGENFHDRGRRFTEQVELMRALWTQEVVNFEGRYHRVTHAGINPSTGATPHPRLAGRLFRPGNTPDRPHWRRFDTPVRTRRTGPGAYRPAAGVRQGSRARPNVYRRRRLRLLEQPLQRRSGATSGSGLGGFGGHPSFGKHNEHRAHKPGPAHRRPAPV